MTRCLSDQELLQCYTGEGAADDQAHLKQCLGCAGRYKALDADMALITRALQAPPPRHRSAARGFARWQVAVSAAAVAAAFVIGWALRGASFGQMAGRPAPVAVVQSPSSSHAPIQLAQEPGAAVYAAYVQGAFGADPCSESNDPLEPGCL